jgi:hypothetical protein
MDNPTFPLTDGYVGCTVNTFTAEDGSRQQLGDGGACIVVSDSCSDKFVLNYLVNGMAVSDSCDTAAGCSLVSIPYSYGSRTYPSFPDQGSQWVCQNTTLTAECAALIAHDDCKNNNGTFGSCGYVPICTPLSPVLLPKGTDTCELMAPADGNYSTGAATYASQCMSKTPLKNTNGTSYATCASVPACISDPTTDPCYGFTDPFSCNSFFDPRDGSQCLFYPSQTSSLGYHGYCRRVNDPCTTLSTDSTYGPSVCSTFPGCVVATECATPITSPGQYCSKYNSYDSCSYDPKCTALTVCLPDFNDCAFWTDYVNYPNQCAPSVPVFGSLPSYCSYVAGKGCVITDIGAHPCAAHKDMDSCVNDYNFLVDPVLGRPSCTPQINCQDICTGCSTCVKTYYSGFVNSSNIALLDYVTDPLTASITLADNFYDYCTNTLYNDAGTGLVTDYDVCLNYFLVVISSWAGGPALRPGYFCNFMGACPAVSVAARKHQGCVWPLCAVLCP